MHSVCDQFYRIQSHSLMNRKLDARLYPQKQLWISMMMAVTWANKGRSLSWSTVIFTGSKFLFFRYDRICMEIRAILLHCVQLCKLAANWSDGKKNILGMLVRFATVTGTKSNLTGCWYENGFHKIKYRAKMMLNPTILNTIFPSFSFVIIYEI